MMGHGVAFMLGYLTGIVLLGGFFTWVAFAVSQAFGKRLNRVQIISTFIVISMLAFVVVGYHRFISN